jgi:hypothetical protein
MRSILVALIALFSTTARAETPVVIATNAPLLWPLSIGGSVFVPVGEQHAVRINVASYAPIFSMAQALSQDGDDYHDYYARTTDVGVGLVHYADKRYEGYMVELGGLFRMDRRGRVDHDEPEIGDERNTKLIGVRAMVGWSWLFWGRVFTAAAVGGSVGYQWGSEVSLPDRMVTKRAEPVAGTLEGYLRFGVLLGL